MGRSSLRTPTQISLDGAVVDAYNTDPGISFKVNCDSLSWVIIRYTDSLTGNRIGVYYPKGGEMIAKHNGETWRGTLWSGSHSVSPFLLGHDYTAQMTIFQNYPESSAKPLNTGEGKYDVFLGNGRIQQDSEESLVCYIDKDISSIISPETYTDSETGITRTVGGCKLRIGGTDVLINSYNSGTGKVTLASALAGADTAGTYFELYSNYLACEPFVFKCRSAPVCTFSTSQNGTALTVSGNYSQAEEIAMQYYRFLLYKNNPAVSSRNNMIVDSGERCYTYTFEYDFPVPFGEQYGYLSCEVMTQENAYRRFDIVTVNISVDEGLISDVEVKTGTTENIVHFTLSESGADLSLWRRDEQGALTYIDKITNVPAGNRSMTDRTAGIGRRYRYLVCGYLNDTAYRAQSDWVICRSRRCVLSLLAENGSEYGRKAYIIKNTFVLAVDAEHSDISTHIGNTLTETTYRYPRATNSVQNYETGSFTAVLGSLSDGVRDRQELIKEWLEAVSSGGVFLYKNEMGDVKLISITDPLRAYGKDIADIAVTKISYSWTEIGSVDKIVI